MRRSASISNQRKIRELKEKIDECNEKIRKANGIPNRKQKAYDADTVYIDSLEGEDKIDAAINAFTNLLQYGTVKDIEEYLKKGTKH